MWIGIVMGIMVGGGSGCWVGWGGCVGADDLVRIWVGCVGWGWGVEWWLGL